MSLPRCSRVIPSARDHDRVVDCIVLSYDDRYRRRMTLTGRSGTRFVLDLPQATVLNGGDGLLLDDGRIVEVVAADEPLFEVTCDTGTLLRVAWHLGNRHLEVEIGEHWIRLRRDHVIADMLRGLNASVREIMAPFAPERGAYDHHRHDHHRHDHHRHGDHGIEGYET